MRFKDCNDYKIILVDIPVETIEKCSKYLQRL